jgi:hypothetical protein
MDNEASPYRHATRLRRLIWASLILSLTAALALLIVQQQERAQSESRAIVSLRKQAQEAAAKIDRSFAEAKQLGDHLARDLGEGKLPYGQIEDRMRSEFTSRTDLDGISIAFEPFVYSPQQKLYQEYVSKKPDGSLNTLKGASYNYQAPPSNDPKAEKTAWYHTPLQKGSTWNEPFLATGAKKYLIEYGVPFTQRGDKKKYGGVVTVDFSLQDVRHLMSLLDLGEMGYGMVFTPSGKFIAHPDARQIAEGSILDLKEQENLDELRPATEKVLQGERQLLTLADPASDREEWIFLEPIPSMGWALAVVANKANYATDPLKIMQRRVGIAIFFLLSLLLALALWMQVETGEIRSLWLISDAFSLICAGAIIFIWCFAEAPVDQSSLPITSHTSVERYVERYQVHQKEAAKPYIIPTGLQMSSLKFADASSVTFSAYLWQRYPANLPETFKKGVILPQRLGDVQVEEVSTTKVGEDELQVWFITATLQQLYDPVRFPFDYRSISLVLSPLEIKEDVLLTPDLEAYPLINPRSLPGVSSDVRLNNWHFHTSYFHYRSSAMGANLGLPIRATRSDVPELRFVIATQRHFLGPFIAYLIPALVSAGLTFALLMSGRTYDSRSDLISGLSYIAALFFVIVLAHSALRENIAAVGITYLEYFFILLYAMVALVVLDAFLFSYLANTWSVHWRGHLVSRLTFWPLYLGVLLIISLKTFVFT